MDFLRRDVLGKSRPLPANDDVESVSPSPTASLPPGSQMEERRTTSTNPQTRRFSLSRPTLPALLRGRANTVAAQQSGSEPEMMEYPDVDSPKTPTNGYALTLSNVSSRLDLPYLNNPANTDGVGSPTSSQNIRGPTFSNQLRSSTAQDPRSSAFTSNAVPSYASRSSSPLSALSDAPPYPSDEAYEDTVIPRPTAAVRAERRRSVRFASSEPDEQRLARASQIGRLPPVEEETDNGRSGFRRHSSRRMSDHRAVATLGNGQGQTGQVTTGPVPQKRFFFCFPWIKSRKVRHQILTCFVSGMFLVLMLGVYLALALSRQIESSQFAILIIMMILFATVVFCHALVRLCVYVVKPPTEEETERNHMAHFVTPAGYAIPRKPIRVVLARDEEAVGVDGEMLNVKPPAYGLWRESTRVDPDRIYWQRNHEAEAGVSSSLAGGSGSSSENDRTSSPRPPSYASEDGVDYVVDAQPRFISPTTDVPLAPHPSEARNSPMHNCV